MRCTVWDVAERQLTPFPTHFWLGNAFSPMGAPTRESPGERFLVRAGISKEECHVIAKSVTASDEVFPTPLQGGNSYSVRSGNTVVQFHAEPFDLPIHDKAMEIHGNKYVLPITCKQSQPFYVYTTPYGGLSCTAKEFRKSLSAQKRAVSDLAMFLSQSCESPQDVMDIKLDAIKTFLKSCLDLPDLQEKIQSLIDNLGISLRLSD